MSSIDSLTQKFRDFPGIGPRQAKRFVFFLLSRNGTYLDELVSLIDSIKKEVRVCQSCQRFFNSSTHFPECAICRDSSRDSGILMLVEKDIDLENLERSHAYRGRYFILGGTIPILEKNPDEKARLKELDSYLEKHGGKIKEIIFGLSINAEGEHTGEFLSSYLKDRATLNNWKLSHLGRGLSTGSELEYADSDTLKSALENRF